MQAEAGYGSGAPGSESSPVAGAALGVGGRVARRIELVASVAADRAFGREKICTLSCPAPRLEFNAVRLAVLRVVAPERRIGVAIGAVRTTDSTRASAAEGSVLASQRIAVGNGTELHATARASVMPSLRGAPAWMLAAGLEVRLGGVSAAPRRTTGALSR